MGERTRWKEAWIYIRNENEQNNETDETAGCSIFFWDKHTLKSAHKPFVKSAWHVSLKAKAKAFGVEKHATKLCGQKTGDHWLLDVEAWKENTFTLNHLTFNLNGHVASTYWHVKSRMYIIISIQFFHSSKVSNTDPSSIALKKSSPYPDSAIFWASVMYVPALHFNLEPLLRITHLTCQASLHPMTLVATQFNTHTLEWRKMHFKRRTDPSGDFCDYKVLWSV